MEISTEKSETMILLGHCPVRCKFFVDNKCLHEVKNFKYLGCEISYGNEKDIQQKISTYAEIQGILHNSFKPTRVQKFLRMNVYNAPNLPILLYGNEIGTFRKRDKKRLASI